jgi:hypothetical protein
MDDDFGRANDQHRAFHNYWACDNNRMFHDHFGTALIVAVGMAVTVFFGDETSGER